MAWVSLLMMLPLITMVTALQIPDDLSALFEIEEESPNHTFIGNIAQGAGLSNIFNSTILLQLEYGFIPEPEDNYIQLEQTTGNLRTSRVIDRELLCPGEEDCYINIGIGIVKPSELFQVIAVQVKVLDINDQRPYFVPSTYHLKFSEGDPVGTIRTLPMATDSDSPRYSIKDYYLNTPVPEFELLQVNNPINGLIDLKLKLVVKLDREMRDSYHLQVTARDAGIPALQGDLMIEVSVEDDNDHSPHFGNDLYEVDIVEDYQIRETFFTIQASDNDQGENSKVVYGFSPRTTTMHGDVFSINHTTGELSLKATLDFETDQVYHLEVTATDHGSNPRTGLTTVKIYVLDVNDNAPHITITTLNQKVDAEIMENLPRGKITAHISVIDADSGRNGEVVCQLAHPMFELVSLRVHQYKIVTTLPLNREETERYLLSVQCSDLGIMSLGAKRNITVIVLDENDHSPVFRQTSYSGSIPENLPENSYIAMVNATDADAGDNAAVTFEIVQPEVSKYIRINRNSGVLTAVKVLDYEEIQDLEFQVRASDNGSPARSAETTVRIHILDQNDEAPEFKNKQMLFHVGENKPTRTFVGQVEAVDHDTAPYNLMEYSLHRQNTLDQSLFSIDANSGTIFTTRPLDHEDKSSYFLNIIASDIDNPAFVGSATITIMVDDENDNAPVIHFPMEQNSTFPISNRVTFGYNITKIFATDPDSDKNGNIIFEIESGNHMDAFKIDPKLGYIQTNMIFTDITYREFDLKISIQDEGTPALMTSVQITITVDENVPYFLDESPTSGIVKQTNLTIIIAVAAVSGFVIVILIIAIVVLKTTDCHRPIFLKKHLSGNESPRVFSDLNIKAVEANGYFHERQVPGAEAPTMPSSQTLQDHKLRKESDNHSVSSADLSNTDSGKGPSEEGDPSKNGSPVKSKGSLRSSILSARNSLPQTSQSHHGYSSYGDNHSHHSHHSHQHSPRYTPSEGSYASHSSHMSKVNNWDNTPSHQCTPEKPPRGSHTYDASNGAHGYGSSCNDNSGYSPRIHGDPPPYHKGNRNSIHSNPTSTIPWQPPEHVHRNLSQKLPNVHPVPSRPLKAVNV